MKKRIKRLITRLLWDSTTDIMNVVFDDHLLPIVMFYIDGDLVYHENMFTVPLVKDKVWIKINGDYKFFKVEEREIVSMYGYEVRVHGNYC